MNDLSCGIRMWIQVSFVLSQSTRLTDRRIDIKALEILRCITCSRTVKIRKAISVLRVKIRLQETGVPCATRQETWFCEYSVFSWDTNLFTVFSWIIVETVCLAAFKGTWNRRAYYCIVHETSGTIVRTVCLAVLKNTWNISVSRTRPDWHF